MDTKIPQGNYRAANALGVGFLVLSLAAITLTVSDPVKKQLISLFAATNVTPPTTGYQPAPLPIFVTPTPTATPTLIPFASPSPSPTVPQNAAGGAVTPCFGGCKPEDIMLPGQTPGRVGYVYQNGNIAGFYQAPNGLYYPVGQSANGPTVNDLNNLAQTINLQRASASNPAAYQTLLTLNPGVAAQTAATLTAQCQQDRPIGISCTTQNGILSFISHQQDVASGIMHRLYQAKPGEFTDLQVAMDLARLQQLLARNVITRDEYARAVQQAGLYISQSAAIKPKTPTPTPVPTQANLGGRRMSPTPTIVVNPGQIGVIGNVGGNLGNRTSPSPTPPQNGNLGGGQVTSRPTSTPNPTGQSGVRVVDMPSTRPGVSAKPTQKPLYTNFAEFVRNQIEQARQNLGIGPSPTPQPKVMPSLRAGYTETTETRTAYVNTDNGLITTTTEVIKNPDNGRVIDTNVRQTRITQTQYRETPTGIVRVDTITTTDLTTGRVIDSQTSSTQISTVQARLPNTIQGRAGFVSPSPTPPSNNSAPILPGLIRSIVQGASEVLGIPTTTSPVSPTAPTQPQSPGGNLITLISNILNPNQSGSTGTIGTRTEVSGFGNILNPPPTGNSSGFSTGGNITTQPNSPQVENTNPPTAEDALLNFAENQTSQCYQGHAGNYNACIGGYYKNEILQPGDTINPIFGGNPEGNPNSMYFCTTLIIDAARQIGVDLPNSTGALQMYSNFQSANSVIPASQIGLNGNSIIKPGMVAFVDQPTGDPNHPYNVGHAGLVQSVQAVGGTLQVTIIQTNADTIQATYQMDSQGRLYTVVRGNPYYIRGFGDITQFAQNTNQQVTVPSQNQPGSSNSNTPQSQNPVPGNGAVSATNQSILSFAEQQMTNCVPGRGGGYNACVGEYYNGTVLTSQQAATLSPSPWEDRLNNGDPTQIYWCTELVIDAAKNAGVPLGNNINNIRPVHAMYNEFQKRTTTYTQNDINAQNAAEKLKPGMVVFINTPKVDPLSEFDHAAIIKDVNVVSTVDQNGNPQNMVNVTIVQSNSATVEATFEMDANGKLVYKAGEGTYNMVGFADLTNYVP